MLIIKFIDVKCKDSLYLRLNGRMIKCLSKPKIPKQMKPWRKRKYRKGNIKQTLVPKEQKQNVKNSLQKHT